MMNGQRLPLIRWLWILSPVLVSACTGGQMSGVGGPGSELSGPVAGQETAAPPQVVVSEPSAFSRSQPALPGRTSLSPEEEFSDCDPLVPENCMLPFPNNFWLREDPSSDSGFRVQLGPDTLPRDQRGNGIDPTDYNTLDGFPPIVSIMAYFEDLSLDNVPHHWDLSRSLDPDCPTILLDAETGERLPHFAELNESGRDRGKKAFMIWPLERLKDSHRYIVAMRSLLTHSGEPVEVSDAFLALRDGITTNMYDIEGRRETFEDIFARLEEVGVNREDLQLAWDFNTASLENLTDRMLFMREDAFERIPPEGPAYRIVSVEDDFSSNIFRKIIAQVEVPLYLTSDKPGAVLVLDEQGTPQYQGTTWVNFEVLIPYSLRDNQRAGRIVQYGHGLFGSMGEVESGYLGEMANRYGYVLCAADWWGMSSYDVVAVVRMLGTDLSNFKILPERSTQGMLNALFVMKTMMGSFSRDEAVTFEGVSVIDPTKRSYFGNSQGGILGGVYMAVSTDVQYGVLGVPGAPYNLLLPRSADFNPFYVEIKLRYPDLLDQMILLGAMQMQWDRAEPSGYLGSISGTTLPNTPDHRVIFHYGLGDAQVSWLGAYLMARSVDAVMFDPNVAPSNETLYGFEYATGPVARNVIVGYDYGVPDAPVENIPPDTETDTHEKPRREFTAQEQMYRFFETGIVEPLCDGACDPQ